MMRALGLLLLVLAACQKAPVAVAPEPDATSPKARHSEGCGQPAQGAGTFAPRTITVDDLARTYHVRLPARYDPHRAYALVLRFHGTGGDGMSGGLDIERAAGEQAIVVAPDGIEKRWGPFEHARNIALFDALYGELTKAYCIDVGRVFVYGFSAGGAFANELACIRAEKIRASAGVASRPVSGRCTGETAAFFMHDEDDDVVPFSQGEAARDHALTQNHCGKEAGDVGNGCVRYQGCKAGEPVIFCRSSGLGHDIRGELAPRLVWQFFRSLY